MVEWGGGTRGGLQAQSGAQQGSPAGVLPCRGSRAPYSEPLSAGGQPLLPAAPLGHREGEWLLSAEPPPSLAASPSHGLPHPRCHQPLPCRRGRRAPSDARHSQTPIPAGSYLALLQTRAFSHPAAAHLIPLTKCLAPSFAGMGWDGMGLNGMGLNGMGWGMQPFHCAPSPAEEQDLCRGRIWPLQGHRDANFSQKQWITAHQLQSILCRGRKQREKRNKKRFLSCRGFGGFVVFGGRKKKKV